MAQGTRLSSKYIGKGTFGKVALAKKKDEEKLYAIKIIKKRSFSKAYSTENAISEKEVMMKSRSPFIVKLHYTFQDDYNLYFCLDYIPGGELFAYLQSYRRLPTEYVRFYAAEVLLALEHLHSEVKAIYRDLKPENVMINYDGHVKLIDFGLSKSRKSLNPVGQKKTMTFCGTQEYIAPEILAGAGYDRMVDYWTFGCFIYELLVGHPPFRSPSRNKKLIYELINRGEYKLPHNLDDSAADLIKKLLVVDVSSCDFSRPCGWVRKVQRRSNHIPSFSL